MISREVRRLQSRWNAGTGWPKRLEWIEIDGIRGWTGQRFSMRFPVMTVVGENGVGKSTVLQAAASIYRPENGGASKGRFASDFFLDTPWDNIEDAEIRSAVREGDLQSSTTIRKPTNRWRGNPARRQRNVEYIDLSRIQPVPARVGYIKIANRANTEAVASAFEQSRLARFCSILGRSYDAVKMATTTADPSREVPVITNHGAAYSGFHQGAGETTLVELLQKDLPKYSLVLIDEIETSLHPRMQRRLVRDLAEVCRQNELQIIFTTHSPYILEELPPEARAHVFIIDGEREIVYGVSPEFSMSRMDDVAHYECDLYVEDERASLMLAEILAAHDPALVRRCQLIPFGAASVGKALGQMKAKNRFPRPSVVFLDGDAGAAPGCVALPGDDAPEPVIFGALRDDSWRGISERTGRQFSEVADALSAAMTIGDHHAWVGDAATRLVLSGDALWQAMCAQWASNILDAGEAQAVTQAVEDALQGLDHDGGAGDTPAPLRTPLERPTKQDGPKKPADVADPSPVGDTLF